MTTESWEDWKARVDAIAKADGLTPKLAPPPQELETWRKHWREGKTPEQAWRAVPYKRSGSAS